VDDGLLDMRQAEQTGRGRAGPDLLEELERLLPAPQVDGRPGEGDQDPGSRRDGVLGGAVPRPFKSAPQSGLRVPVVSDGVEVTSLGQEVLDDGIRYLDDIS